MLTIWNSGAFGSTRTNLEQVRLSWYNVPTVGGNMTDKQLANKEIEIYQDEVGYYRFCLKAPNGEVITASKAYETKQNCHKGIESIKHFAPDAEIVEVIMP